MAHDMVYITPECKQKLCLLAKRARKLKQSEIGGFGWARKVEGENRVIIYDVMPAKHETYGSGDSTIDKSAVGDLLEKLGTDYLDKYEHAEDKAAPEAEAARAAWDDLRVWWHAHPTGISDYSSTDHSTLHGLDSLFKPDWMVGLLTNGDFAKAILMTYQPFRIWMPMEECQVDFAVAAADLAAIDAAVEEVLPAKPHVSYGYGGQQKEGGFFPTAPGRMQNSGNTTGTGSTTAGASDGSYMSYWRHNQAVTDGKDLKWSGMCEKGACTKKPRFMNRYLFQYCYDCFAKEAREMQHNKWNRMCVKWDRKGKEDMKPDSAQMKSHGADSFWDLTPSQQQPGGSSGYGI